VAGRRSLTEQAARRARALRQRRRRPRRSACTEAPPWTALAEERLQRHLADNIAAVRTVLSLNWSTCDARVLTQAGVSICPYTNRPDCDGRHPQPERRTPS
jgi:hypothetical protein